jgi:hypothetical protein
LPSRTIAVPQGVSFTVPANLRSRAVMQRLGMTRDPGADFEPPELPPGHPRRRQVSYRLAKSCGFREQRGCIAVRAAPTFAPPLSDLEVLHRK